MQLYFTICSNNYLGYAKVLGGSIKQHNPSARFIIVLCDEIHAGVDYSSIADEVIPAADIEPRWTELSRKYNIIELNTCIKPRVFEYLFDVRGYADAVYFDPDICVYAPLDFLHQELRQHTILLTPHICTPINIDGLNPSENTFLNFGIYNLGFIAVANRCDAKAFLTWWKAHTYELGYIDVYKGIFVDQLPVNLVPIFFSGVKVLMSRSLNMAPWNLHERKLLYENQKILVENDGPLVFYHFSSFKTDRPGLPSHIYNRYKLEDRLDLVMLYKGYQEALIASGQVRYAMLPFAYDAARKAYQKEIKRTKWRKKFGLS